MPPLPREILFITGPTAVGKSEIALHLARRLDAALLVMDSIQVYRGADIGTSKPSLTERREIAHGGIDLVGIGETFDVAAYLRHAAQFLERCARIGQPVVIVGGTGLYYRALTSGLCEAPPAAKELREELTRLTLEDLQQRLQKIDPRIISTIDFKNPRRIARAIEVMESTGKSLRDWQQTNLPPLLTEFRSYFIDRPREELHDRINARVDQMLAAGWREEVRALVEKHGQTALEKFPAIGYPEIARWLQNGGDWEAVRAGIALGTRQYAKRQLTWFRRERNLTLITMGKNDSSTAVADRLL